MIKDFSLLCRYFSVFKVQNFPDTSEREKGRALRLLPLFGLLLGLIIAVVAYYTSFIGYPIAAVLALAVEAFLTRCIHIQGTMNSLSGLNTPREVTETGDVTDTKVSSMIWAVLLLIFKYTIYLILIQKGDIFWAVPIAFVFSRWLLAFGVYTFPVAVYGGLSYVWKNNFNRNDFLTASLIALVLFLVFNNIFFWFSAAIAVTIIFFFCRFMAKRTGGLNGDSLSAVTEWGEVFFLLVLLFFQSLIHFINYLTWMIF